MKLAYMLVSLSHVAAAIVGQFVLPPVAGAVCALLIFGAWLRYDIAYEKRMGWRR